MRLMPQRYLPACAGEPDLKYSGKSDYGGFAAVSHVVCVGQQGAQAKQRYC